MGYQKDFDCDAYIFCTLCKRTSELYIDGWVTKEELFETIKLVLTRPNYKNNHLIDYEELSTKERIQILLMLFKKTNVISFSKTLKKSEGKKGAVVTLLASLELAKDGHVELVQNNSEELFIKSLRSIAIE